MPTIEERLKRLENKVFGDENDEFADPAAQEAFLEWQRKKNGNSLNKGLLLDMRVTIEDDKDNH